MAASDEEQRTAERAARNEVVFREANERLQGKRRELELDERTPFLCECDDPACTALILLSLAEYERVRSHATWFLVARGHDADSAEEHDGYAIVEKRGVAASIAEEENPRS